MCLFVFCKFCWTHLLALIGVSVCVCVCSFESRYACCYQSAIASGPSQLTKEIPINISYVTMYIRLAKPEFLLRSLIHYHMNFRISLSISKHTHKHMKGKWNFDKDWIYRSVNLVVTFWKIKMESVKMYQSKWSQADKSKHVLTPMWRQTWTLNSAKPQYLKDQYDQILLTATS